MDRDGIVKRIGELEQELAALKTAVAPPQGLIPLRGFARFLLSYWVLLSFLAAVATAVYVKYAFQIDYFETYRDQAAKKEVSELHRKLGERLLARAEWEAAANAYKEALKVNPNNVAATVGLVEAQVFLPSGNQKFAAPEIIDAKLQVLKELKAADDYIVHFLVGMRHYYKGDYAAAKASLEKSVDASIAANKPFAGGYVNLGFIEQSLFNLDRAIACFRRALELDPESPDAHNNLGFTYVIAGQYDEAVKHLAEAEAISPRLLSAINLGDAYRYKGDYLKATQVHEAAVGEAKRLAGTYELYAGGDWLYNLMPLHDGDAETMASYVMVFTQDQKLSIANFALALDYALSGRSADADRQMDEAQRLAGRDGYRALYLNKIAFLQRFPDLDDDAKAWLAKARTKLSAD
jgi:tetratricopeptide (TPR) repeat protein